MKLSDASSALALADGKDVESDDAMGAWLVSSKADVMDGENVKKPDEKWAQASDRSKAQGTARMMVCSS